MKERSLRSLTLVLGPWIILFVLGIILGNQNFAIQYFNSWIGFTSFFTLLMLWYSSTGNMSESPKSVLISLVAISLKMAFCAVIFIYHFYKNKNHLQHDLAIGTLAFFVYTSYEVYVGLKFPKSSS